MEKLVTTFQNEKMENGYLDIKEYILYSIEQKGEKEYHVYISVNCGHTWHFVGVRKSKGHAKRTLQKIAEKHL